MHAAVPLIEAGPGNVARPAGRATSTRASTARPTGRAWTRYCPTATCCPRRDGWAMRPRPRSSSPRSSLLADGTRPSSRGSTTCSTTTSLGFGPRAPKASLGPPRCRSWLPTCTPSASCSSAGSGTRCGPGATPSGTGSDDAGPRSDAAFHDDPDPRRPPLGGRRTRVLQSAGSNGVRASKTPSQRLPDPLRWPPPSLPPAPPGASATPKPPHYPILWRTPALKVVDVTSRSTSEPFVKCFPVSRCLILSYRQQPVHRRVQLFGAHILHIQPLAAQASGHG